MPEQLELPLPAQVKLLRFLDSRTIERLGSVTPLNLDVRIIAATNRDLRREVDAGRFRADLFYRLGVIQIQLPPLRERPGDVLLLARAFLSRLTPPGRLPPQLDAAAGRLLEQHAWPGNVRELRNAIEHALAVSGTGPVMPAHLPETVRSPAVPSAGRAVGDAWEGAVTAVFAGAAEGRIYEEAVAELERRLVRRALERFNGNQSAASDWLGMHRNSLRRKIKELGLGEG